MLDPVYFHSLVRKIVEQLPHNLLQRKGKIYSNNQFSYSINSKTLSLLNARLHGLRLGNFSYVSSPLFLGDLDGNQFVVVLRLVYQLHSNIAFSSIDRCVHQDPSLKLQSGLGKTLVLWTITVFKDLDILPNPKASKLESMIDLFILSHKYLFVNLILSKFLWDLMLLYITSEVHNLNTNISSWWEMVQDYSTVTGNVNFIDLLTSLTVLVWIATKMT